MVDGGYWVEGGDVGAYRVQYQLAIAPALQVVWVAMVTSLATL